ncbi:RNA methyltransferase, partial [Paenibacillus sepulcri]|nr:RNA methyltransferase [Paenibacillus sepulcri]
MNKPISHITSIQNDTVKAMAALLDKKHRDRSDAFLVEGVHLVQESLLAGADVLKVVYDAARGI